MASAVSKDFVLMVGNEPPWRNRNKKLARRVLFRGTKVIVANGSSHITELLKVAVDDDLKRPPHFRDETNTS